MKILQSLSEELSCPNNLKNIKYLRLIKQANSLENALWSCDLRNVLRMILISTSKKGKKKNSSATMVCVFSDGKKGKHKWWTKVILLTKLKVWSLYYSLDLILSYELGRLIWFFFMLGEWVVHEEHEHGSIGGLCMLSASSVLNVLKTSTLCFRAASAGCKKNNRSFLLCVSHY